MDHQVNNDIPSYINNHQIASFLQLESYPYTFGVPYLNNNPNNLVEAYDNNSFVMDQNPNGHNFEILNQVKAYDNNSFVMDQNPNDNSFEILNQVEVYDNNSFAMEQNPNNNNFGRFNQAEA
ncbi:hypothetical protein KY290_014861 [Solanum tuberosum]|uniref:Uncharacterized protein n=1 Tax=Solanum tuberosum TaxID=4113 RepID=A0ABQ7VST9_SOLTU|nr:hypothetical protein KY290_014861 [Solanum tuberosum]